jgi:hypothetical protein
MIIKKRFVEVKKDRITIKLVQHKIMQVVQLLYQGNRVTSNRRSKKDIDKKIGQINKIFYQKTSLLMASNTGLEVRKNFLCESEA